MLSFFSLPTVPLIHSCHLYLWLTEKAGPSGVKRETRLPQRETPRVVAASHRPFFLSPVLDAAYIVMRAPMVEFVAAHG